MILEVLTSMLIPPVLMTHVLKSPLKVFCVQQQSSSLPLVAAEPHPIEEIGWLNDAAAKWPLKQATSLLQPPDLGLLRATAKRERSRCVPCR